MLTAPLLVTFSVPLPARPMVSTPAAEELSQSEPAPSTVAV